jgi:hypothetical protein
VPSRVREAERKTEENAFRELREKTVHNYVSAILEKLHLNNRIELATYAVAHQLIEKLGRV